MSKIDRGVKRRCASCEAPFYDMMRYPIRCPKCGADFDATAGKRLASVPRPPKARAPKSTFGGRKAEPRKELAEDLADEAPAKVADEDALDDAELDADEVEDIDEVEDDGAEADEAVVDDDGDGKPTGGH